VIRAIASSPSNNLHWFQSQSITPRDGLVKSLVKENSYELWHQHFGHPSKNAFRQASSHVTGLPTIILSDTSTSCKGCALGKMHDCSYPPSGKRATCPLSLIHTDLVGPMPTESQSRACMSSLSLMTIRVIHLLHFYTAKMPLHTILMLW
jgi:hypothetical protein